MKKDFWFMFIVVALSSCNTGVPKNSDANIVAANTIIADTNTYPFKASFSSDLKVPSHPEYAQKVLTVWKMYERKEMEAMKPYYADTVTYQDAAGNYYYGPTAGLLAIAKKEMDKLDSLRFDISMWESVHANDKNEDWVNIWCSERNYPKTGKPDTVLMYEQWKLKDGRVYYFNQYQAKLPRK